MNEVFIYFDVYTGQERKRIQPEKVSSYQPFQSNIDTNNINEFSDKATPR